MRLFTATILLFLSVIVWGQNIPAHFEYQLRQAKGAITIDGNPDELAWSDAQVISGFFEQFPQDSILSSSRTEVKLLADEQFLYVTATCYLRPNERFLTNTLYRDFDTFENDAFMVLIDPFGAGLNGFSFELTPFGSQGERLISNGGTSFDDFDYNWDNKWFSSVNRLEDRWVVEMAIPFRSLRFKSGQQKWRLNLIRRNRSDNSFSSWHPIPVNLTVINMGFMGDLIWENPPKTSGFNYSLIPSTTYNGSRNYSSEESWSGEVNPSLDFKLNFGSSLNLDGTINPDFSQIEVDQQQLNIGRFELFFPERRQFFLENSDLFSNFGNFNVRPFFSRRIGLRQDANGFFNPIALLGGIRLSGKIGEQSRIGIMNVQTDRASLRDENNNLIDINGRNYTVAAYQQQVLKRSSLSALVINSQEVSGGLNFDNKAFSRVLGGQFEWVSNDNSWNGNAFYFHHFEPGANSLAYGFSFNRSSRHFGMGTSFTHIRDGFAPESGFVPRTDVNNIGFSPFYVFRPKNPKITNIDIFFDTNHTLTHDFEFLDANIFSGTFIGFSNTSNLLIVTNTNFTRLLNPFDPSFSGGTPLEEGSSYFYPAFRVRYRTDQRKRISAGLQVEYGDFFNGKKFSTVNTLNLRWQPYLQFALDFEYNDIRLAEGFGSNELFLIRPQARISFRNNLFLTYILQYNSLQDNIGSNIRLQWRFRPVSDLFLVYTDNYTEDFVVKSRGIAFKLIYWL